MRTRTATHWTDREKLILEMHYRDRGARFCWRLLNTLGYSRTLLAVEQAGRKMGYYVEGNTGCFKKGIIPWNKGLRMVGVPLNAGNFRKGHTPKNHVGVGTLRRRKRYKPGRRGYWWIKVAEPNKWMHFHRWLWIQENGPIPRDRILVFRNGDQDDVRIDNLQLIDRAEHVRRNHNVEKAVKSIGCRSLSDKYISMILARGTDKPSDYYINQKDLLELKRQELLLKRAMKCSKSKI